jgi:hypothetical protein
MIVAPMQRNTRERSPACGLFIEQEPAARRKVKSFARSTSFFAGN